MARIQDLHHQTGGIHELGSQAQDRTRLHFTSSSSLRTAEDMVHTTVMVGVNQRPSRRPGYANTGTPQTRMTRLRDTSVGYTL